jgi:hypothetical protein
MEDAIRAAIDGDVRAIDAVASADPTPALGELHFTSKALLKVLGQLRRHEVTAGEVQKWASFIRRGYVAGIGGKTVVPLLIEYEPTTEDVIVEVIARLDEIGDAIDGVVSDDEIDMFVRQLITVK